MNSKFSFATDFHGNLENIDAFLKHSKEREVSNIIFGGDIAPTKAAGIFSDNKGFPLKSLENVEESGFAPAPLTKKRLENIGYMPFQIPAISSQDAFFLKEIALKIERGFALDFEDLSFLKARISLLKHLFKTNYALQKYLERFNKENGTLYGESEIAELFLRHLEIKVKTEALYQKYDENLRNWLISNTLKRDLFLKLGGLSSLLKIIGKNILHLLCLSEISDSIYEQSYPFQKEFFHKFFTKIKKIREQTKSTVSLIMGNNDLFELREEVFKAEGEGIIINATNKLVRLSEETEMLGISYIPNSTETEAWKKPQDEVEREIKALMEKRCPARKLIINSHIPPANTGLGDAILSGMEVSDLGSSAINQAILKHNPILSLHGHAHEAYLLSGLIRAKINDTYAYNPGASEYQNRFIFGDFENPGDADLVLIK